MFTGIIQEVGRVKSLRPSAGNLSIEIEYLKLGVDFEIGSSIAVNGACLTIISKSQKHFRAEAVKETLEYTNIGELRSGLFVNLEMPLKLNDLLHGHLVHGHIDCVGQISRIMVLDGSHIFTIKYSGKFDNYIIKKGSVAIDGISLTVAENSSGEFQVSIIPHTFENTIFKYKKHGDSVNLEFDLVAKYIEKMISSSKKGITPEFLKEHGY